MPAKKQSAKGQAGKKGAIKSSSKKDSKAGNSVGFPRSSDDQEAPVIVKGGPQLGTEEGEGQWIMSSATPLDYTFTPTSPSMPNIYSQSIDKTITGFFVRKVPSGQVVFCYDSSTEGEYEIIFGSPECEG